MVNSNNQIAIVTDDPGWHGRKLTEALQKHGFHSRYVSLTDCEIELSNRSIPVKIPGFENQLPIAVFVRGVPGGSLEQVIFRLNVLHLLEDMGVTVFNTGRAIERTVDKCMTSYLLKKHDILTPDTFVTESYDKAIDLYQRYNQLGKSLVIKPLFGSQGIGIQLFHPDLIVQEEIKLFNDLYYLQEKIETQIESWEDIRVFVIDGKARFSMLRKGTSWITNRTQGAECVPMALNADLKQIAEAAAVAVDIDYCGVDLMMDRSGNLNVLEVNSIPAWWGLQKVVGEDVATHIIDAFVRKIRVNSAMRHLDTQ